MQRNGSRLRQLIYENWAFVEAARAELRGMEDGRAHEDDQSNGSDDEEEWEDGQYEDERDILEEDT